MFKYLSLLKITAIDLTVSISQLCFALFTSIEINIFRRRLVVVVNTHNSICVMRSWTVNLFWLIESRTFSKLRHLHLKTSLSLLPPPTLTDSNPSFLTSARIWATAWMNYSWQLIISRIGSAKRSRVDRLGSGSVARVSIGVGLRGWKGGGGDCVPGGAENWRPTEIWHSFSLQRQKCVGAALT